MSQKNSNTNKQDFIKHDDSSLNKNQEESNEGNETDTKYSITELQEKLNQEKQRANEYENKLKLSLADFQNLEKNFTSNLEKHVNSKIDGFILDFLKIFDDFVLAKDAYRENNIDTSGLDSILKNMSSLLSKYGVIPIEALGEIFNPNFHDAVATIEDNDLDDGTITKVIRKGYISHQRVIRPALVEISKKSKSG